MNIIETKSLSHRYWRTEALQDLTLSVPEGSVFALLGPNGAGARFVQTPSSHSQRPMGD